MYGIFGIPSYTVMTVYEFDQNIDFEKNITISPEL